MSTNAIPTMAFGIQFRSRLEARWAAWFELVGWHWHYEPMDLDSYIPDFIVEHADEGCWLVSPLERHAKPTVCHLVEVKSTMDQDLLTEHAAKIQASGWEGPAAIVGATLWPGFGNGITIGANRFVDGMRTGWGAWNFVPKARAIHAWHEAGNLVQWRGARKAAAAK